MSIKKTTGRDLFEVVSWKADPEQVSTVGTPTQFDKDSVAVMRAAIEKLERSPGLIAGIVITSYIFPGYQSGVLGEKRYILVNRDTWGAWVPSFKEGDSHPFMTIAGIPVLDDEELAKRIILYTIEHVSQIAEQKDKLSNGK